MSAEAFLTVLLVDDHAVVREGYRRLLERSPDIRVCGEAASGGESYHAFCRLAPDVVVMDISLPDLSGIEAMRRLLARDPSARVLIFSIHDEPIFPDRAFRSGARGYVTKASAPDVLVEAVRAVAGGGVYLSPDIAQAMARKSMDEGDHALQALSSKEFEILRMLAQGSSLREIATTLCLTYKTVANHQSSLRRKLHAETPAQLFRVALENGLIAAAGQGSARSADGI